MDDFGTATQVLVERLKSVQSEDQINLILGEFAEIVECDWYIFAISQIESMQTPGHKVFSNAIQWMQCYAEENLRKNDPVVKYIVNHQSPALWNAFSTLDGYNSPEQLAVLEKAGNAGLKTGFSIPCHSFGNFAVFSLADGEYATAHRFNSIIPFAYQLANQLLETALNLGFSEPEGRTPPLTAREIECLFWGSEGKTAWEISQIIGVSERTVVFHFTNATEKLGASSRQHAISKALLRGIVQPKF